MVAPTPWRQNPGAIGGACQEGARLEGASLLGASAAPVWWWRLLRLHLLSSVTIN